MRLPTHQFFITGLPRSRSAWFANLFTWGDSICYHDALCDGLTRSGDAPLKSLYDKLEGERPRGHSCSSNVMAWRILDDWFPNAPWVVIDRPFSTTLQSCQSISPEVTYDGLMSMNRELTALTKKIRPMVVQFESIEPVMCYQIAEHLGIDIGPTARVRQLCDMNIQIHPPILKARINQLKIGEAA